MTFITPSAPASVSEDMTAVRRSSVSPASPEMLVCSPSDTGYTTAADTHEGSAMFHE